MAIAASARAREHLVQNSFLWVFGVRGAGLFLLAGDGGDGRAGELIDGGGSGVAAIPDQPAGPDSIPRHTGVLIGAIPTDVVDVGDELAAEFIDQVQEGMAVEVDPDEGAGDAAFIA